jgi:hypothetical protein
MRSDGNWQSSKNAHRQTKTSRNFFHFGNLILRRGSVPVRLSGNVWPPRSWKAISRPRFTVKLGGGSEVGELLSSTTYLDNQLLYFTPRVSVDSRLGILCFQLTRIGTRSGLPGGVDHGDASQHKLRRMATLTLDPSRIDKGTRTDRYIGKLWEGLKWCALGDSNTRPSGS